jgi:hypothetical protein
VRPCEKGSTVYARLRTLQLTSAAARDDLTAFVDAEVTLGGVCKRAPDLDDRRTAVGASHNDGPADVADGIGQEITLLA